MSPTKLYSYFVGAYCGVLFSLVLPRKKRIYCKISVCLMCEHVLGYVGDVRSSLVDVT